MASGKSIGRWLSAAVVAGALLSGCIPGLQWPGRTPASNVPATSVGADFVLPTPQHRYPDPPAPDRPLDQGSSAQPPGFAAPPPGSGYARYFDQGIEWADCDQYKCATFLAPLDWHDPDGQAITIAMRKTANGPQSGGVLFINPGGPGASAQDYVASFPADRFPQFEVIGLDSRGSGASTPVVCGDGPQTDALLNVDSSPDDQAERDAFAAAQLEFNQLCRRKSGPLLDHISTIETIYDYDLARHLLGQQKLNYYGISYGTFLGAVYAELYPQNVGRMVLDSAVNLTPSDDVIQAQGFDLSLRNFANWCAQSAEVCAIHEPTEQQVVDLVVGLLNYLDAQPMPTGSSRKLTQSLGVSGVILFFYFGSEAYADLAGVLDYTLTSGDGSYLLQAADMMNDRGPDGSFGSLQYSFPAIRCVDEGDDGLQDAFDTWAGRDTQMAPLLGHLLGPDVVCPLWTAQAAPQIDFTGAGAPPLLVIQNTGDSATPYRQAEIMAEELESATLVVREAPGHGAFASGSTCMDKIVADYYAKGKVPAAGTRCTDG